MKKWISPLLALALLLTLAACAKKDPPPAEDGPVQSQEPVISDTRPSGGDEAPAEPTAPTEPEGPVEPVSGGDDTAPEGRIIRASHEDVTLFYAGETFRFSVWDSDGKDPDVCTFISADPEVAAVDESGGEVKAVAPGFTTITAHAAYGEEQQDFQCIVRCAWKEEAPDLPAEGDAQPGADAQPGGGSQSGGDTQSGGSDTPTLSGFFTQLQGRYEGLGSMMVMDGELLENYYPGLSAIEAVEEVLIQETALTTANVAVGLVRLSEDASAEDVLRVQSVLQGRVTAQADGGAWYPASCETWEQGVITSTGSAVGMFVYPEKAQDLADAFTSAFGE